MVKERDDARSLSKLKPASKHTATPLPTWGGWEKIWSSDAETAEERKEEAKTNRVTVTIRSELVDTTMICTGIAREGNTFLSLVKVARERGLIHWNEAIVALYLLKEGTWQRVVSMATLSDETFSAGDHIMVVTQKNRVQHERKKPSAGVGVNTRLKKFRPNRPSI